MGRSHANVHLDDCETDKDDLAVLEMYSHMTKEAKEGSKRKEREEGPSEGDRVVDKDRSASFVQRMRENQIVSNALSDHFSRIKL